MHLLYTLACLSDELELVEELLQLRAILRAMETVGTGGTSVWEPEGLVGVCVGRRNYWVYALVVIVV